MVETRPYAGGLLVSMVLLAAVVGMLWAFQRQLIYYPDTTPPPPADEVIPGSRGVALHARDCLELAAWFVPAAARADSRMALLLAPSNGGNPGSPSGAGLIADAYAAAQALEKLGYPAARTLYFGESLGTGVVAAQQAERPPAGMVLRSPFTTLADVGSHHYPWLPVRTLLRDRYPVVEHLASSDVPMTVIYGDRDSEVPSRLSARVADQVPSLAERVVLLGADHNDPVMFGGQVADAVARLAEHVS